MLCSRIKIVHCSSVADMDVRSCEQMFRFSIVVLIVEHGGKSGDRTLPLLQQVMRAPFRKCTSSSTNSNNSRFLLFFDSSSWVQSKRSGMISQTKGLANCVDGCEKIENMLESQNVFISRHCTGLDFDTEVLKQSHAARKQTCSSNVKQKNARGRFRK